jgi:predicted aspartyl protease
LSTRKALTAFAVAELLFGARAAAQNVTPEIAHTESAAPRSSPASSVDRHKVASKLSCMNARAPVASPPNAPVFSLQDSLERAGYTRVSLKRMVRGHITVDGRINRKEVKLIVDTATPTTRLDRERVANFGPIWVSHDIVPERMQLVRSADFDAFALGAFNVGSRTVYERSLDACNRDRTLRGEQPVDGLLGADVLRSCGAIIDFASESLFLIHGDSAGRKAPAASPPNNAPAFSLKDSLERAGYTRLSLETIFSGYLTVDGRINGKAVKLIVDTGAPKTHLDSKRVAISALRWDGHYTEGDYHQRVRTARVDAVEVGSFSVGGLRVGEHSLGDVNQIGRSLGEAPVDGLLGCEILSYCRAIIDYSSECMFLAHRDGPDGK